MERTIRYDRENRDFAAYVEDVLIGFYGSYHAAELACDEYVYDTLARLNGMFNFGKQVTT